MSQFNILHELKKVKTVEILILEMKKSYKRVNFVIYCVLHLQIFKIV